MITTIAEWRKWNALRTKPMTNYDSLIRKTPEEMAKWLGDKDTCPPECWKYLYDDVDCAECWLAWMKQEASE